VFFWRDALGRLVRFKNKLFLPQAECGKPVIYLYPEHTTSVSVSVSPVGGMTFSEPDYGNGWTVTARPDGQLTDDSGARWPYLFWEGRGGLYEQPKKGWVVKRLGEIGRFSKGQGIKKDDSLSGEIPCIRYGELYTRHHNYIKKYYSFISQDIANTSVRLRQGDILFAGSGETKDEIGKCAAFVGSDAVYAGSDIVILSPLNANSIFLGFVLNSKFVVDQKANRGQGDAVVHISGAQLQEVLIPYPTLDKQAEIATTLLEIDSELMVLTSKLDKYKKIKQGMMQNLLTGKIRLI
jgi:restriction endonuclease S subunit